MNAYSRQSKLAAYRSVSAHGAVADGDPHTLVLTLFDAVLGRLMAARACIETGEITRKAGLLHSSVVLLAELRGSLDLQKGGQLAQNLSELYDYMTRRLVQANVSNDAAAVTEVLGLLEEIRAAWAAIAPEVRSAAGAAAGSVGG